MGLIKALEEYTVIVEGLGAEYTQSELTVAIIREEHPELDFMDDEEIENIIRQANDSRG
jgi:hypothetical protein